MAKSRKPTPPPAKTGSPASTKIAAASTATLDDVPAFFQNTRLQSIILFVFAFLLYANTLGHQWAQDDAIVITDNMFTQKGAAGIPDIFNKDTFYGFFKTEGKASLVSGGRYRPLTLMMFALVYQVVGSNPMAFHLLTVLLFAFTCLVLYRTLLLLLRDYRGSGYAALAAWISTLLFAAHPIHTEVVANVKGCDEIVTLLGSLAAMYLTIKAFDTKHLGWSAAAGLSIFLGLLAKENAVTFLGIIPLALIFFRKASLGETGKLTIFLMVAFAIFFGIRSMIVPLLTKPPIELMNNPFMKWTGNQWVTFTAGERLATIFYTLGKYVQLLFAPITLTHDYYPRHVDIQNFGKPAVLGSLALYGFLLWYAVSGLLRGQRDLLRFGILFYLFSLSIVSNVVFPIGTNMGERFMFMPSIGFCLAVAAILLGSMRDERGFDLKKIMLPVGIAGVVALLFAVRTFTRNPVWYDDKTLFFNDITTSVNSAKLQNACGGVCCTEGGNEKDEAKKADWYRKAIPYLTKATQIHPTYKDAYLNRGIAYFHLKNFDASIADFRFVIQIAPDEPKGPKNLAIALRDGAKFYGEQKHDIATALKMLNESYKINSTDTETMRLLGVANGNGGKHPEAIRWFEKVTELQPENASAWFDLGMAYGASGNVAKAQELQSKALKMNPKLLEERAKVK